jgi:hypothetical protein
MANNNNRRPAAKNTVTTSEASSVVKSSAPVDEVQETLAIMEVINVESNPNKLENPWPRSMTVAQAEAIIEKYKDYPFSETPNELLQARKVLGK